MKKLSMLFLLVTLMFVMVSCTGKQQPVSNTEGENPQVEEGNIEEVTKDLSEDVKSHYPVTITNYNYAKEPIEITFEKAPEKVLAVYQNSIETLLALGLEDKIIAAAGLDHAVKQEFQSAFDKVNYLEEFAPDKETVIMMEPDFILSWYSFFGEKRLGEVDYWHQNNINTYMYQNSGAVPNRVLENEYEDILNLGKIFNVEDKAQAIVDEIQTEVARVVEYAQTMPEKKRVMIIEFLGESITVYGEKALGGDMAIKLGADLISVEGGKIGTEDLISYNPDVIFVVYMDKEEEDRATYSKELVTKDPVYASLDAVINNNVHTIQLGEMYCSGVRTMDGINVFASGMYPELYE